MKPAGTRAGAWLTVGERALTIEIAARPGASRRGVVRLGPQGLVIALNAAPERGKANDELVAYLAGELDLPRSAISVIRGTASRHKTVRVTADNPAGIAARIEEMAHKITQ